MERQSFKKQHRSAEPLASTDKQVDFRDSHLENVPGFVEDFKRAL
jgi:hypothetical protein